MQKAYKQKIADRIIDANINRTKEGLRVCEEITRFILDNRNLTSEFKKIRHKVDIILGKIFSKISLIEERKSLTDVGKGILVFELKRKNYQDIFFANMQRVKESVRVLEEFSKLKNINIAVEFKKIRYNLYELEKKVTKKILPLRHYR